MEVGGGGYTRARTERFLVVRRADDHAITLTKRRTTKIMAVTTSFTNQSEDPEDAAAEAEAARAREEGTDLIREHLNSHLDQNPSSSYVVSLMTRAHRAR